MQVPESPQIRTPWATVDIVPFSPTNLIEALGACVPTLFRVSPNWSNNALGDHILPREAFSQLGRTEANMTIFYANYIFRLRE